MGSTADVMLEIGESSADGTASSVMLDCTHVAAGAGGIRFAVTESTTEEEARGSTFFEEPSVIVTAGYVDTVTVAGLYTAAGTDVAARAASGRYSPDPAPKVVGASRRQYYTRT